MKRRLALLLFALLPCLAHAQGTVTLTASSLKTGGGSGNLPTGSQLCAMTVDAQNRPAGYRIGTAGGQTTAAPGQRECHPVTSGGVQPFTIINSGASSPLNACIRLTQELANGQVVRSDPCVQTGTAASFASGFCVQAGGNILCDYNAYPQGTAPLTQTLVGPPGPTGPSGCTGSGCTGLFSPDALNGFEVHVSHYGAAGATGNVKLAAAEAAWAGTTTPLLMVFEGPTIFDGPYTTVSGHSLEFRGPVTMANANATLTLTGDQRVSCAPGVTISGPGNGAGYGKFLYADSGSRYELGDGCNVHDMERFVYMPKGVSDVKVSGVRDFYNLFSLAFIGNLATIGGFNADQPSRIEFSHIRGHDSKLALDLYYSHSVHSYDVDCTNLGLYCITGSGGDASTYSPPDGSATELTADHITCHTVTACVFFDRVKNFEIGGTNYAADTSDMGFDCEGCSNGVIHHALCDRAATGCVSTLFGGQNVVISDIMSPDSGIALKNSSNNADLMSGFLVKDSTVASLLIESFSNLEISNVRTINTVSLIGYHNGLYMHDMNVQMNFTSGSTNTCMICVSTSSGGRIDRYARNYAQASGTPPSGLAMFQITEANFNFSANIQMQDNTAAPGIPFFLRADSTGGNGGIYPTWHLHFNHRGGATLSNPNSNGRGTINEDSVYDGNEQLHIIGAQTSTVP